MSDSSKNSKKDILEILIDESKSYSSLEQIEKQLQTGQDFSNVPVQPLYLSVKTLPPTYVGKHLEKFSKEQRKTFLDLDLWQKDSIDINHFDYWVNAYSNARMDIKSEFVKSNQFALYLKGKFNVWTFDLEEPEYPDHDNFFITDDNLLLFEFDENFELASEIQSFVRSMYHEVGVENAYSYFFKLTVDSYLSMEEEEYQLKKERMRDFGFVDYYDALEIDNIFINKDFLDHFIKKKTTITGDLDSVSKMQNLHKSSLVAYKDKVDSLHKYLEQIEDQKRLDFLNFNFIRLVNATISLADALKDGQVAMTRVGNKTRSLINLGLKYVEAFFNNNGGSEANIFERFEFTDLYKIGNSLIKFNQKKINSALSKSSFSDEDNFSFMGSYLSDFIDNSFERPARFLSGYNSTAYEISDVDNYDKWVDKSQVVAALIPFLSNFYEFYKKITHSGQISDEFYLNYTVAEIDFEAILISGLFNEGIGNFDENETNKMGITVSEFKEVITDIISTEGKLAVSDSFKEAINTFLCKFGLDGVDGVYELTIEILKEQLEGYDYLGLDNSEFKHVGGPMLLNV